MKNKIILGSILGLLLIGTVLFMYCHPNIFPMHGYTGPIGSEPAPANIRLTGDSWRYISGGNAILHGQPLDDVQRSYSGYCLIYGLAGRYIIVLQVAFALAALIAIMAVADKAWLAIGGSDRYALPVIGIAGALFACNPEFSAWHGAIMTESIYTSCVCINAFLALWATQKNRKIRMNIVAVIILLTAFIRPTGWIQLPAVACYWICTTSVKARVKLLSCLGTLILFTYVAICVASHGINSQSPTMKLYLGEVVWQETLWNVDMPVPENVARTDIVSGLLYGLRHPMASAWLVTKRLAVMFTRIRPSYSTMHNLMLLAYHLPLALLGIAGLILYHRHHSVTIITAMLLAHSLVVALTFNDNDGRFTLYFTPLLATAAVLFTAGFIVPFMVRLVRPNATSNQPTTA